MIKRDRLTKYRSKRDFKKTREPEGARVSFALGAMSASAVWFVSLGYGARALAPLFRRAGAWRVLDGAIGSMVLLLAVTQLR